MLPVPLSARPPSPIRATWAGGRLAAKPSAVTAVGCAADRVPDDDAAAAGVLRPVDGWKGRAEMATGGGKALDVERAVDV
jgi:hypothetical protein